MTASVSTKDFDCDLVAGRRFFLDGGIPFQIKTDRSASVEGEKDLKCKKQAGFMSLPRFTSGHKRIFHVYLLKLYLS